MSTEREELDRVLQGAGWLRSPRADDGDALDALYVNDYAAVGIALRHTGAEVVADWVRCQEQLAAIRTPGNQPMMDLYLLFLVPNLDGEASSGLHEVLSDTHVCRKICLERRGRPMSHVLYDSLLVPRPSSGQDNEQTPLPIAADDASLLPELLVDLTTRSSETILAKALGGSYNRGSEQSCE